MIAQTYTITFNTDFWNGVTVGWIAGCFFIITLYWFLQRKTK